MADPFVRRSPGGDGVLARVLRRSPRASVIREIEDALARAERVRDVSPSRVAELAARHGVDLTQRLRTPRCSLYRRFLESCLLDQAVSTDEAADLRHLKTVLQLEDADAARVHEEVAHAVYGCAIDRVLEDHRLDPEEEQFLRQLSEDLDLSPDTAERLFQEGEERARQRFVQKNLYRDDFFVASRNLTLELSGTSETSLEEAVRASLEEASRAVPGLRRIEVDRFAADIEDGRVVRWHVKVKAKREADR